MHAGNAVVDLKGEAEPEKRKRLRTASAEGLVLTYMPGHIMLHLGEVDGQMYALSAVSEYVRPCGEAEQTVRLDRVVVTNYDVGRHTARRAFLERLTTLGRFGGKEW